MNVIAILFLSKRKFQGSVLNLALFLSFPVLLYGQGDSLQYNLSSPYHAIFTHLSNLQENTYNPGVSAKAFSIESKDPEKAAIVATQLKQILDGAGHYIYLDDIPKSPDYFDSLTQKHRFVPVDTYPNIYVEKVGDRWLYPEKAVREINLLHESIYAFGTDKLLQILPKFGTSKILGLYVWQLLGILMLTFTSFLTHRLFTLLFEKLIINLLHKTGYKDVADTYILPIARPLSVFFIVLLLVIFVPVLQLSAFTSQYIIVILKAALPLLGTMVFYRLVNILSYYLMKLAMTTESTLDDQLVPLIRKTLKSFVVVVGSLFILQNLNIPIIPLLTGLSIGGLAFALAAQDTIKNFFGSLMIFIDKPFQIGDWITSEDVDGTVEEVGFRSTRIRSFRNSVFYIPNGQLADKTIDNHGLRKYRRFFTTLSINYDTPPELIQVFIDGLKRIVENHPDTRKDYHQIYLNDLGDSSLSVMFYIFFEVPEWGDELRARHEVLLQVLKLAHKLGINFAFPTRTLHVENFPEKETLSAHYADAKSARKKFDEFFSKGIK